MKDGSARLVFVLAWLVAALLSSTALADKQSALREYKAGRAAYDLGRFEVAIGHFEAAYEAQPAPEFLFNIAQSHRQLGRCRRALFFYRRYLRLDPKSKIRDEVLSRIAELEQTCAEPPPSATDSATVAATAPPPPPEPEIAPEPPARRWIALSLEAGVGLSDIGDLEIPVQPSFRLGVGIPLTAGPVELRLGGLGTLLPVPYDGGTALLGQALAHAELSLAVTSWLRIRAEAGAGVLILGGLDDGNPFTTAGATATGALSMFTVRAGAGLEVPISDVWQARLTAASFSYSPPKTGLRESIDRLLRFEVTAGVGVTL